MTERQRVSKYRSMIVAEQSKIEIEKCETRKDVREEKNLIGNTGYIQFK